MFLYLWTEKTATVSNQLLPSCTASAVKDVEEIWSVRQWCRQMCYKQMIHTQTTCPAVVHRSCLSPAPGAGFLQGGWAPNNLDTESEWNCFQSCPPENKKSNKLGGVFCQIWSIIMRLLFLGWYNLRPPLPSSKACTCQPSRLHRDWLKSTCRCVFLALQACSRRISCIDVCCSFCKRIARRIYVEQMYITYSESVYYKQNTARSNSIAHMQRLYSKHYWHYWIDSDSKTFWLRAAAAIVHETSLISLPYMQTLKDCGPWHFAL